jgi:hypothetical protein
MLTLVPRACRYKQYSSSAGTSVPFHVTHEIRRQRVAAPDRKVDLRIRLAVVANQAGLPEVDPWACSHKNAQES